MLTFDAIPGASRTIGNSYRSSDEMPGWSRDGSTLMLLAETLGLALAQKKVPLALVKNESAPVFRPHSDFGLVLLELVKPVEHSQ